MYGIGSSKAAGRGGPEPSTRAAAASGRTGRRGIGDLAGPGQLVGPRRSERDPRDRSHRGCPTTGRQRDLLGAAPRRPAPPAAPGGTCARVDRDGRRGWGIVAPDLGCHGSSNTSASWNDVVTGDAGSAAVHSAQVVDGGARTRRSERPGARRRGPGWQGPSSRSRFRAAIASQQFTNPPGRQRDFGASSRKRKQAVLALGRAGRLAGGCRPRRCVAGQQVGPRGPSVGAQDGGGSRGAELIDRPSRRCSAWPPQGRETQPG